MSVPSVSPRRLRRGRMFALTSIAVLLGFGLSQNQPVQAQPAGNPDISPQHVQHDNAVHAVGLRYGRHGMYRSASVFWQSPALWSRQLENGWGRLDLLGEASVTYWDARHGKHSSMWQMGVAPFLRWWPSSDTPFYLEAGFGPTWISHTQFANYRLSTAVQFGSHVGVGYVFGKRHQISLRASHFSNASIKQPNDGLNVLQLDYAIRF